MTKTYANYLPVRLESPSGGFKRCAHTHPPFKITDSLVVYGGAASDPVRKDHDIYVSLDSGTYVDPRSYPWNDSKVVFIIFPIIDMSAPRDPAEFKKLIAWLVEQLNAGKSIHIGCIGGHGRTGMVLAALYKEVTGNPNAIEYVRKHYCEKAVETSTQINFLNEHFGIAKVKGTKDFGTHSWSDDGWGKEKSYPKSKSSVYSYGGEGAKRFNDRYVTKTTFPIKPFRVTGNIWGFTDSEEKLD